MIMRRDVFNHDKLGCCGAIRNDIIYPEDLPIESKFKEIVEKTKEEFIKYQDQHTVEYYVDESLTDLESIYETRIEKPKDAFILAFFKIYEDGSWRYMWKEKIKEGEI